MVAGDLTASDFSIVDVQDEAAIITAVAALNLALVTDNAFIIPLASQNKVIIFKVEREA